MNFNIVPIPIPKLVPRKLLEQVKDKEWEVDDWYEYQEKLIGNEENLILGLVDENLEIRGICWLTIDGFSKWIFINTLSVENGFVKGKELIKILRKYIKELGKVLNLKYVMWVAKRHKGLKRYGLKESPYKLMEEEI